MCSHFELNKYFSTICVLKTLTKIRSTKDPQGFSFAYILIKISKFTMYVRVQINQTIKIISAYRLIKILKLHVCSHYD